MSQPPNFIYSDPNAAPVALQGQPGPAAETAYQVSNGEYFFQLASGGSANRNNFTGAVTIQDPNASLVVDGPITGSPINTASVISPGGGSITVTGTSATLNGLSGNATVQGGAVTINCTEGGSGMQLQSVSTISVNATSTIGIVSSAGPININSGNSVDIEGGAGGRVAINSVGGSGPVDIGTPLAPSGNVNIAGGQVAFTTASTTVPMTVQYGVPGNTGYLYDTKLNPVVGPAVIVGTYQPGLSVTLDVPFTVPHSGYYLLTSTIFYAPQGGAVISFPVNTYFTACLTTSNASYIPLAGSAVVFNGVGWTTTGNAPVQSSQISIVQLTAGIDYYSDLAQVGTISLAGNGSGVGFQQQIQALGCSYS